ncbi:carboxylic acid transporter protein homolog [Diutina catenulata]
MPPNNYEITAEDVELHNKNVVHPPKFTIKAISHYLMSRPKTLFISRQEWNDINWSDVVNPFKPLYNMNRHQWNMFALGFWAWTWDAFDYFITSLNASDMAIDLNTTVKNITWGMTLVLMFRSLGAVLGGMLADSYSRKYAYIVILFILCILQIGTANVTNYKGFLGVKAIFGIAMGSVYGVAMSTALDDADKSARGVLSGLYQEGYAFGNLLCVAFNRGIGVKTGGPHRGWRNMHYFSAGVPAIFLIWRLFSPETEAFKRIKEARKNDHHTAKQKRQKLYEDFMAMMKNYWLITIFLILCMSGMNFSSHGSQDMFPTLLTKQYEYSPDRSTVTNAVANLGAIAGGFIFGHLSNFFGRRLIIIIASIVGGACIYPWAFIQGNGINAGAFFLQFGVQGAWGVIPAYLMELCDPRFASLVGGTAYQLGNLCSSASSTIEATIADSLKLSNPDGSPKYFKDGTRALDYGKTMAIFMGAVFAYNIVVFFLGPEYRHASLDVDRDRVVEIEELEQDGKSVVSFEEHAAETKEEKV